MESSIVLYGCDTWPTKAYWKSMTMKASAASTRKTRRLCAICGTVVFPLPYKCTGTTKKSLLVWSCYRKTYFCPYHLGRGADELEASWKRGQPGSRQTGSPPPVREFSMDKGLGESLSCARTGPSSLGCLRPRRGLLDWFNRFNPLLVNSGTFK